MTDADETLAMNVIRMIKLFGWEPRMNNEISEKRDEELRVIKKRQLLELLNNNIKYVVIVYCSERSLTG